LQDEPTEIEIAYIAALLEGEGTFLRKGFCPIIQLGMTDLDVIEKAARIINIRDRKIHASDDKRPNHKIKHVICVAGRDAMKWMKLIRPHMCSRRGMEIDGIINAIAIARPFYELGSNFCKRGHSIKNPWEYFQHSDGGRRCKRCMGVIPKLSVRFIPIDKNFTRNHPGYNPFTRKVASV
jgi:hypothetical protein